MVDNGKESASAEVVTESASPIDGAGPRPQSPNKDQSTHPFDIDPVTEQRQETPPSSKPVLGDNPLRRTAGETNKSHGGIRNAGYSKTHPMMVSIRASVEKSVPYDEVGEDGDKDKLKSEVKGNGKVVMTPEMTPDGFQHTDYNAPYDDGNGEEGTFDDGGEEDRNTVSPPKVQKRTLQW